MPESYGAEQPQRAETTRTEQIEQYRAYEALFRQINSQKAVASYFFLSVGLLLILAKYWLIYRYSLNLWTRSSLSVIGGFVSLYWFVDLRRLRTRQSARYRVLLKLEDELFGEGFLRREWDYLGDRLPTIMEYSRGLDMLSRSVETLVPLVFFITHLLDSVFLRFPLKP